MSDLPPAGAAPHLELVVAVARNGAIGRDGGLAWDAPEDLRHFRAVTLDHTVIMGARTWESIGRPLPRRHLIVVTSRRFEVPDGVELSPDPEHAVRTALARDTSPMVGGGTSIYAALLPQVTRIHWTDIDIDVPAADAFFPSLDPADWRTIEQHEGTDPRLTFRTLDRVLG